MTTNRIWKGCAIMLVTLYLYSSPSSAQTATPHKQLHQMIGQLHELLLIRLCASRSSSWR